MKSSGESLLAPEAIKSEVRARYGAIAATSGSCCGPASGCGCGDTSLAIGYVSQDLEAAPDGANLGLGCGNPVALASLQPGETVLDLGSGAGFDAFLAAKRVGPSGRVIGVDMTPEMLSKARNLAAQHGYTNVEFRQGDIESLPVEDACVDTVISNCVINLTTDKARTFREAHRVLKPGGRLMVSDLVLLRPLPLEIRQNMDAYAACLAGALLKEDYLAVIEAAGFRQISVVGESSYDFGTAALADPTSVASLKISAVKSAKAPASTCGCGCR
jgi:SAM-dependent methyltransferase